MSRFACTRRWLSDLEVTPSLLTAQGHLIDQRQQRILCQPIFLIMTCANFVPCHVPTYFHVPLFLSFPLYSEVGCCCRTFPEMRIYNYAFFPMGNNADVRGKQTKNKTRWRTNKGRVRDWSENDLITLEQVKRQGYIRYLAKSVAFFAGDSLWIPSGEDVHRARSLRNRDHCNIHIYFLFNISFRFSSRSLYIQMCVVTIFKMTLRINKKYMGIFLYVFKKRKPWHGQLHTPVWSARFYPRFPWLQKWIRVLGKNKNFWRNSYGYNACGRGKMMSIGWLIGARQISLSYSPWLLNN